ncbi:MAG: tyrosine-type recombinase/integrase [Propionibacteriaceae bacterium]|nr:tyrosine-type recombinase/integrase [Propionibacteriaceae bacterium]
MRARSRPNTVLATWFDLKVFFSVVGKPVDQVRPVDVLGFITAQRAGMASLPDSHVSVLAAVEDGAGVSLRTIRRRLSTVGGLYAFLMVRGDVASNPVPRGLPTRREKSRPSQGVPLVRSPRTLPRILSAVEVDALTAVLRTHRDRAMVAAMLLGGLRRCEVLGLRLSDVRAGEKQLFIAEGKGGHQRLVPVSPRFFEHLGAYLDTERPADADNDVLFLVLKRPHRGGPLSAKGLEQVLASARERAGLSHGSCHELRHTCLTRLREAGMALEAVQAQAGHASIESTRIYLHLADDWLASQYRRAAEVIDAQVYAGGPTGGPPQPYGTGTLERVAIPGFRRLR